MSLNLIFQGMDKVVGFGEDIPDATLLRDDLILFTFNMDKEKHLFWVYLRLACGPEGVPYGHGLMPFWLKVGYHNKDLPDAILLCKG